MLYARNRIYISPDEQEKIKNYKIFIAGAGIGSVIAECALRLGFENITIADGDTVELSNLNRQNYVHADIGESKTESLKQRLLNINPNAQVTTHNIYLTENNISSLLEGHQVAINALDFDSATPFAFDALCKSENIPVLHPYNIGWASFIIVILPDGPPLASLSNTTAGFEKVVVRHLINGLDPASFNRHWIERVLTEFTKEEGRLSPPQLSVGCYLLAGSSTHLMYKLATGAPVKSFPEFYFLTTDT